MDKFAFGEVWERKVRSYIKRLDLDGDGKLTRADYEMLVDSYLKLGQIDELRAKQITRRILGVWDSFFSIIAADGAITTDQWIAVIRRSPFLSLFRVVIEYMNLFFDLIDTNGDGVIQKEEFAFFLKIFCVEEKAEVIEAFQALDTDGDGKIDHNEFMNAAIEYWMSNDDSLPSKLFFGPLI